MNHIDNEDLVSDKWKKQTLTAEDVRKIEDKLFEDDAADPTEKEVKVVHLGSKRGLSAGVVALLASMAVEQMSTTMSRNAASKRTGTVTPHDGRVKRSNLTREDFPSRQAWRAHQREQEKADKKGLLYG